MKRLYYIIGFVLVFGCFFSPAAAQNTSTQGKEFWLTFMHNGFRDHTSGGGWITTQVLISAKRDCTGTVANPLTGWQQEFSVRANSITTVEIPEAQGYHDQNNYETISQKGIKVEANDTISVYCTNIAYVSFDASFVLPTESLGDEYIIQSFDQSTDGGNAGNGYVISNETSAFAIVATEDNTVIDITPKCNTLGGRQAGETFSITMNAGETYHVRSTRSGVNRDLSGTKILAADCKKIAVFNGNTLTCVPTNTGNGFDHIFEQAMPLRSWGKQFVVTSSLHRTRDFIKITSSANDNIVTKNGEELTTLREGQSYTFYMPVAEQSCYLETTQPSAVYLTHNSSHDFYYLTRELGDPSMVWIAPVEQRISDVTFSTFDHAGINITNHCVNIIVETADTANVYLDDAQIQPRSFSRVNGNDSLSFTRLDIDHGVHRIVCPNGFNAHVYGFGDAKGYAYLVGSNAIDLSTNLTINGEVILPNESFQYCADMPITFSAEVNQPDYEILWDFGDGTTSDQNPTTHAFNEGRIYDVSVAITTTEGGCTGSSSNTTTFSIDATQQYIVEHDEVCSGELYSGYGFSNVHILNDTILTRLQANPIHGECQDSVLVYITANEQYHIPIEDSRCWQGEPGLYDDYGFSFVYDQPGTYDRQLNLLTVQGCDSILNLHLTVASQVTHEFSHHECSSSYVWDGQTYTAPGDYERAYVALGGCDSIVTMHLTMGMPQHTTFDTITCSTFHWNGQAYSQSGTYQQTFTTIDGCDSIVDCHLTLSGNVEGATANISECDSYFWIDSTYTQSGLYEKTLSTALGCDSLVRLNLDLEYTPNPTDIYPADPENTAPHWVVTATEFQINDYEFTLWDNNPSCHWDSVAWAFEDPNVQWVLEPDTSGNLPGRTCKIYVLNHIDDTVWLNAKVYNQCHPQGVERRYWFVCSFYGLDDIDPAAHPATFTVIPNPNNGEMSLNFEHLTGKIDIKVYDMSGSLIDHLQTYSATDRHTLPYQCTSRAKGIYCFVVTGKEGTVTRKIIVQ